jgi:hypothetical protein
MTTRWEWQSIMAHVMKQLSRLIVPFAYEATEETLALGQSKWWEPKDVHMNRLFTHIEKLVSTESYPFVIGKRYHLTKEGRQTHGLPPGTNHYLTFAGGFMPDIKLTINQVECTLFESNVGFLTLDIHYPKQTDIRRLIEANHQLKKLYNSKMRLAYLLKGEQVELHLRELTQQLLAPLKVSTFFEASHLNAPFQALVFQSYLLDEPLSEEEVGPLLFWMRRTYTDSYSPNKQDEHPHGNPEVLQLYANSYWGISLEGCANLAFIGNHPQNEKYFKMNYLPHVKSTYFYLYLLSLHQRYALLHFSMLASESLLSGTSTTDHNLSLHQRMEQYLQDARLITELKEKIILFKLRSVFKQVSNTSHHTAVYNLFQTNLHIDQLLGELHFELDSLSQMVQLKEQKRSQLQEEAAKQEKEREEDLKTRFNTWVVVLSFAFVLVSTIADGLSIFEKFAGSGLPTVGSAEFVWFCVLFLLIPATALGFVAWFLVRLMKKSKRT